LVIVAAALVAGALSAVFLPGLGHDAWAWMIWARELGHLNLDTTTGSTIKPLPMLLMIPAAPFGDAAPFIWLTISRAALLLVPVMAWQVAARLGAGQLAAGLAAAFSLLTPVLFDAAVMGYSEPLTVLLVLVAISALQSDHHRRALVILSLAGLMRPELWPFTIVLAAWSVRRRGVNPLVAASLALGPVLIWAGLSWAGSGVPFGGIDARESIHTPAGVLGPLAKGVIPTVSVGFLIAAFLAWRQANRALSLLIAACVAWIALFGLMILAGFSGNSRYLTPAEVVAGIVAAWGIATAISMFTSPALRQAATFAAVASVALFAALSLHTASNSVRTFHTYADAAEGMKGAIAFAGGRDHVLAIGKPVVMNWSRRTALAWQLDLPITGTQTIWQSAWTGSVQVPALLIAAPPEIGGARAKFPVRLKLRQIGKSGDWSVFLVLAHGPHWRTG
jgi:hypothetical protein